MSLQLSRRAEVSANQIAILEGNMATFYRNTPASYYAIADQSAPCYQPDKLPFHCDLVGRVSTGMTVLEAGCGTAHLCPQVQKRGGVYTGLDHSPALLEDNRRRFPAARFFPVGTPLAESFDLVASLYTLEHVADPPAYLEQLWQYCRPGGLIGIICPEFVDSPGFPPSFFYGGTPRRLSQKLRSGHWLDALSHWLDWKIRAPRWKKAATAGAPGGFWLNLAPRVLHGAAYDVDADAIHMTRLKDLAFFFQNKGAEILKTSAQMTGLPLEFQRYGCYVMIRKPDQHHA